MINQSLEITDDIVRIINDLMLPNYEEKNGKIFTGDVRHETSKHLFELFYPTKKFPKIPEKQSTKTKHFFTISTNVKLLINNFLIKEFILEYMVAIRYLMKIGFNNEEQIIINDIRQLIFIDPSFKYKYNVSFIEYLYHLFLYRDYYRYITKNILHETPKNQLENIGSSNVTSKLDEYVRPLYNKISKYIQELCSSVFSNLIEYEYIHIPVGVYDIFAIYISNFILNLIYECFNLGIRSTKVISSFGLKPNDCLMLFTNIKTMDIQLTEELIWHLRNEIKKIENLKEKTKIDNKNNFKIKPTTKNKENNE